MLRNVVRRSAQQAAISSRSYLRSQARAGALGPVACAISVQPESSNDRGARAGLFGVLTSAVLVAATLLGDEETNCQSRQVPERRGRYVLYKELGRGGFSVVRLAVDTKSNTCVAAKIFDPKLSSLQAIRAEIDTLKDLGLHRNIVSLHDVLYLRNETIMFTDLVEGGELFDYIADMGSISERDASRLLRDVCQALCYVHSHGICHRDLKPENVLLTDQSTNADLKLADFGLSQRLEMGEQVVEDHPNGTMYVYINQLDTAYWAPEIIKRQPQGFAVDMWAFGVLAYITLTGVHPFDPRGDNSDAEIITQIAHGSYDVDNVWYDDLSTNAKDFLARLLDPNPETRLTATQALQHPWLRGQTTATTPLPDGHAQRLQSYQRLQKLRANILTVIMGVQHFKFEDDDQKATDKEVSSSSEDLQLTSTVNMDMFKEAFVLFDKDESGGIDKDELSSVMRALGQRLTAVEIDAIMRDADTDGDGKISFMEFVTMMNKRLFQRGSLTDTDLKAAFNLFDNNGDGYINSVELAHVLRVLGNVSITDNEIDQLIQAVDVNGDGKIDFDEFGVLMRAGLAKKMTGHMSGAESSK